MAAVVYTGPKYPTLLGKVAGCAFLVAVINRAHALMCCESFFLDAVVQLATDVYMVDGTNAADLDFRSDVVNLLNTFAYSVSMCSMEEGFAEAVPANAEIKFENKWIQSHADDLPVGSQEYNDHFAMAVIKYFHEFAHLLTPGILEIDQRFRQARVPKLIIPVQIGRKRNVNGGSKSWMGDMGYRLEEILFGGRVYAVFPGSNWTVTRLYFVQETNKVYTAYDISPTVYNAFIRNIIAVPPYQAAVFIAQHKLKAFVDPVTTTTGAKKRKASHVAATLTTKGGYEHFEPRTRTPGAKV